MTAEPEIPAPAVTFAPRRVGDEVEIVIRIEAAGEFQICGFTLDLPTARAWRAGLDAAIGSGLARTQTPHS